MKIESSPKKTRKQQGTRNGINVPQTSSAPSSDSCLESDSSLYFIGLPKLQKVIGKVQSLLFALQNPQGYWVFDLEADSTIPSEYILLQRFLGREIKPELKKSLTAYLRSKQLPDGGWPLFEDGHADISASVKTYFALKLLGDSRNAPHMIRARQLILSMGGAVKVNVFTRITLALFGQISWDTPPAMPIEIMLLPKWFFFHLSKISYWSRSVLVPLLILYDKRPVHYLSPAEGVRELFVEPPERIHHIDTYVRGNSRKNLFILLDRILKHFSHFFPESTNRKSLSRAVQWTLEHMQGEGGIGAIFPAMANAIMALKVLGYPQDHPDYLRGVRAIDNLLIDRREGTGQELTIYLSHNGKSLSHATALAVETDPELQPQAGIDNNTLLCQPCNSPIWDTCLCLTAMLESGADPKHPQITDSVDWLISRQINVKGDWSDRTPRLEPGGWPFQFENTYYPDLDDTAMVVMALLRAGALKSPDYRTQIAKAVNWVIGMQNADGGWGAFDIDNNALYLNDIPFADHGALLDPSTPDLAGRCIEMLATLGYGPDFPPIAKGLRFLLKKQEQSGAWFGRWGVNYIYGTWSVLCALNQAGEDMSQPFIQRAVDWLKSCQNADNGWGETCYSYDDPSLAGKGVSTASQTAWALLGLMATGEVNSKAVQRGIRYLLEKQNSQGGWNERHFTGTGFPKVFYLRYHGYSQYFPLWALGVYRRLKVGQKTCQNEVKLTIPADLPLPTLH